MNDDARIPLVEAIRSLRRELATAVKESEGEDLRFRLRDVELELQMGVTTEAGGEGGIQSWVVSLGAKGSTARVATHTVKLSLEAIGSDGSEVLVSSEVEKRPD